MEAVSAAITTVHMDRFLVLCLHSAGCKVCMEDKSVCGETTGGQGRARSSFEWRERESSRVEEVMVREKSSVREGMIKGDCDRERENW